VEEYIEGIQRADLANDRFRQGGWWRMATSVFLVTKSEAYRATAGSSDVDEK
jgi:hypothetical protein